MAAALAIVDVATYLDKFQNADLPGQGFYAVRVSGWAFDPAQAQAEVERVRHRRQQAQQGLPRRRTLLQRLAALVKRDVRATDAMLERVPRRCRAALVPVRQQSVASPLAPPPPARHRVRPCSIDMKKNCFTSDVFRIRSSAESVVLRRLVTWRMHLPVASLSSAVLVLNLQLLFHPGIGTDDELCPPIADMHVMDHLSFQLRGIGVGFHTFLPVRFDVHAFSTVDITVHAVLSDCTRAPEQQQAKDDASTARGADAMRRSLIPMLVESHELLRKAVIASRSSRRSMFSPSLSALVRGSSSSSNGSANTASGIVDSLDAADTVAKLVIPTQCVPPKQRIVASVAASRSAISVAAPLRQALPGAASVTSLTSHHAGHDINLHDFVILDYDDGVSKRVAGDRPRRVSKEPVPDFSRSARSSKREGVLSRIRRRSQPSSARYRVPSQGRRKGRSSSHGSSGSIGSSSSRVSGGNLGTSHPSPGRRRASSLSQRTAAPRDPIESQADTQRLVQAMELFNAFEDVHFIAAQVYALWQEYVSLFSEVAPYVMLSLRSQHAAVMTGVLQRRVSPVRLDADEFFALEVADIGNAALDEGTFCLAESGTGVVEAERVFHAMPHNWWRRPKIRIAEQAMATTVVMDDIAVASPVTQALANEPRGIHLIVLVHGMMSCGNDMKDLRNALWGRVQVSMLLISRANEASTTSELGLMGRRLAAEVAAAIASTPVPVTRVSFVAHSLGALVVRAAIASKEGQGFRDRLATFVTLSAPHLGRLYSTGAIVRHGFALLRRLPNYRSLGQLSLDDSASAPFLLKLSRQPTFSLFSTVLLVSSPQDAYVPAYSSGMSRVPSLDTSSGKGAIVAQMHQACVEQLKSVATVKRLIVHFDLPTSVISDPHSWLGRRAHIQCLESHRFLDTFAGLYGQYLSFS